MQAPQPTGSQARGSGGSGVPAAVRCIMYEESTGEGSKVNIGPRPGEHRVGGRGDQKTVKE
ncbi:hypothetical protein BDV33DRAFT_193170 [Aspergillus novoparasiticus]|uniref:Uncharacterized protein n=2 Tax=Aspergillus subgen. Circumdati TaxID=2720871 RepID=A0A5N6EL46_9EURO|nr:hypothetical protein BDV33DRAFT_193170 [Aspergillus novoparasiticus]KAE8306849.1 hypothetical protein BDV41DRAFT_569587 [Aspergillus transmontanensis]